MKIGDFEYVDESIWSFQGYEIIDNDLVYGDYPDHEKRITTLNACIFLVKNKMTLRETAVNFLIPKLTLWDRIYRYMPKTSPELFKIVKKQLQINYENRGKMSFCH